MYSTGCKGRTDCAKRSPQTNGPCNPWWLCVDEWGIAGYFVASEQAAEPLKNTISAVTICRGVLCAVTDDRTTQLRNVGLLVHVFLGYRKLLSIEQFM
jgi:hypothetical protein